jgi:S1-C subfamily serine protease
MIAFMLLLGAIGQEPLDAKAIYKRCLPSVLTVISTTKNGDHVLGTAFLAIKDGVAVTAWHVVKDASKVTARFSDGQEFEIPGLIDKDEKRDVALIRVKVADRQLLEFQSADPEAGSKCFLIGAPEGLEFSISDGIVSQVRIIDGIKQLQFTCAQNHGNSGGPLLDDSGKVLGVADWKWRNTEGLNFAIAGSYAKGLDSSLPTQQWSAVVSQPTVEAAKADSEVDAALVSGLRILVDARTASDYVGYEVMRKNNGYRNGVPSLFYETQRLVEDQRKALAAISSADKLREDARAQILSQLTDMAEAMDLFARSVRAAQAAPGWNPEATDLSSRGYAALQKAFSPSQTAVLDFFKKDENKSKLPLTLRRGFGLEKDPSGFRLSVGTWVLNEMQFIVVYPKGFADKLGFRVFDLLQAVDGAKVSTVDELKQKIKDNVGRQLKVTVLRQGKVTELTLKIPKELPAESIIPPA